MNNKNINAIIIDDENGCIINLRHYLTKLCPEIIIVATGPDLHTALCAAKTKKVDIAFLDVEIFDDNIFNALAKVNTIDFKIVFVTAYEQYALKAIKTEALDYILKPLCEDDLVECYLKIKRHFFPSQPGDNMPEDLPITKHKKIILKNSDKVFIINSEDIYYMAALGPYTEITFVFNNELKTILISKGLNKVEQEYERPLFFRVHKSYIINTARVLNILREEGLMIQMQNKKLIPVAKRRANDFISVLNNKN